MNQELNKSDKKILKGKCVFGYSISIITCVLLIPSGYFINYALEILNNAFMLKLLLVTVIPFSLILGLYFNYKYYIDLLNGFKVLEANYIHKTEKKVINSGEETYNVIVDHYRYRIKKDIYEQCESGEEVYFYFAPKSRTRLGIELKKQPGINIEYI